MELIVQTAGASTIQTRQTGFGGKLYHGVDRANGIINKLLHCRRRCFSLSGREAAIRWWSKLLPRRISGSRRNDIPALCANKMNALNDPRLPLWFTQKDGAYVGITFGLEDGVPYGDYSHFTDHFFDPKLEVVLSDYSEMEFFLAEAVERGWAVGGTAESHYNNGITASILYYGGTQAAADAYLAQASVDYTTATGNWKEKIGTQKWLAMYNRGIEGWSEWRRLDFPILNFPVGQSYSDIPTRFPYPYTENDMNPSYDAAAAAIGGDTATTKLWWDKF